MIQLVKDGKFREDLYYRLNVFPIWVPPLRERIDDVPNSPATSWHASPPRKASSSGLTAEAAALITGYDWPGNVRQLENAVFRAVVLADGAEIGVDEFPQIAAHVEGFQASIPAAPAAVSKQPDYTGPALLGAEKIVPQTVGNAGRRQRGRSQLARHPGRRRDR